MRDLPAAVRAKAVDLGATAWLENLPELIATLAAAWDLRLGAPFQDPTEAYVVEVTRNDGTPAVLKLLVPRPGSTAAGEITFLREAGGDACARLLAYEESLGALLLERLGPALSDLGLPMSRRLPILCDLAAAVWRPTDVDLPTGAVRAARMSRYVHRKWAELGEPCCRAAVDQALAAGESRRRAHAPGRAVLVHGDIHQWNAMRAGAGFKLVDPDGYVAEPECDLGVLLREDPAEGDLRDRCRWLADRTGTDPRAIWEWGLLDRVATGLTLTVAGLQPVAAQMLAAAEEIAAAGTEPFRP
ncbi:aminoglycoside phosphotransferase family protein [Actinoplanes sp. KI2]|uniref:aminoglycoside phosphotransferase family protein n=1 Tax=Actinoplanes sp. KI2 TaxID=2983315 RepID=UPI0021D58412|nr:aminoglycoside phosphotransferase family protein [Actinoplanes sp. KI2]MCU7727381.1 aminoglycoside phosphotransferase family protein [Actinoplanes sp. KI2]